MMAKKKVASKMAKRLIGVRKYKYFAVLTPTKQVDNFPLQMMAEKEAIPLSKSDARLIEANGWRPKTSAILLTKSGTTRSAGIWRQPLWNGLGFAISQITQSETYKEIEELIAIAQEGKYRLVEGVPMEKPLRFMHHIFCRIEAGFKRFPVDMLRHDNCIPCIKSVDDIAKSVFEGKCEVDGFYLKKFAESSGYSWSWGRWLSYHLTPMPMTLVELREKELIV